MVRYPYRVGILVAVALVAVIILARVQGGTSLREAVSSIASTVATILAGFGIAHLTGHRPELWPSRTVRVFLLGLTVGTFFTGFGAVVASLVTTSRLPYDFGPASTVWLWAFLASAGLLTAVGVLQIAQVAWREQPRVREPPAAPSP